MHPNARRVIDAANARGLDIEVSEFPDGTRTAEDAARAVGTSVGQIVKSLVFVVDGRPTMALVSGANQLDPGRLAAAAGVSPDSVERADADTVRRATGYPIGGVPPFGHDEELPTYLDDSLLAHQTVWAAAGTPNHVFELTPPQLVQASGGTTADLAVPR